jgi:hypothetical protein
MPTISFVSIEEHEALKREVAALRTLLSVYVHSQEDWLPTASALKVSGIKARSTLVQYARASAPGLQEPARITYCKQGVKCLYLRSSCIDYAQRKLGLPSLT